MVLAVVAVVFITGLEGVVWFNAHDRLACPGAKWTVDYAGAGSGYFGPNPLTGCLGYPDARPAGFEITMLLTLTNSAPSAADQVASISVGTPSVWDSISPALPITLARGASANVTLNVTIPTLMGNYVIAGVITTP